MSDRLINVSAVKEYARQRRLLRSGGQYPNLRVSKEYLDALDQYVRDAVDADVKRNGSKPTMMGDVFLGMPGNPRRGRR